MRLPESSGDHPILRTEVKQQPPKISPSQAVVFDMDIANHPDGGLKAMTEVGKESCLTGHPGWNGHSF